MTRFIGLLFPLIVLASCGNNAAPPPALSPSEPTPVCDGIIEQGYLVRYQRIPLPVDEYDGDLEATFTGFLESESMSSGDLVVVNRNIVGGCEVRVAHAKGLKTGPASEILRMLLIEPATEEQPSRIAAAAERRLCRSTKTWRDAPCDAQ